MKLIKICDVKNIYEARTLSEYGVNFIGLHYISPRDKTRSEDLKMIIRLCHQEHPATKTIIVTKEKDIDALISLVNEFECDGLQLHYSPDPTVIAQLKAHFGSGLLIFGVVAPDIPVPIQALDQTDYVILDKSYVGGTGMQLSAVERSSLLNQYKGKKLLLAGGIDTEVMKSYLDRVEIAGFDVQSSVKSPQQTNYENISLIRLNTLLTVLGKEKRYLALGQVGLCCTDTDQLLDFYGACDFWHFDFFDNIFGYHTDTLRTLSVIKSHSKVNSHFRFQIHIFSSHVEYAEAIIQELEGVTVKTLEFYIHHNTETVSSFKLTDTIFASLDIKDIISGNFPLKEPLSGKKVVLCLQSERHDERNTNANAAMKLIREFWNKYTDVTLDRGIFPGDLNYSLEQPVDVVSRRYLHEHRKDGYNELKRSLNNARQEASRHH